MRHEILPVTFVSGLAGAGKSVLIESLRRQRKNLAYLLEDGTGEIFHSMAKIHHSRSFEAAVVECASFLEPYFVVESFLHGDGQALTANGVCVDTLLSVIDGARFYSDLFSSRSLSDIGQSIDDHDSRKVAEVLMEQIEYADILVINKIDLLQEDHLQQIENLLHRLNPRAKILRARFGEVMWSEVLQANLFHEVDTDDGAGWLAELAGEFSHFGEVKGVSSFTFLSHDPFHPSRFQKFLEQFSPPGIVRVKGSVWVATRHHEIGVWSVAGANSDLSYGGNWFASTPAQQWPLNERERAEIMREWMAPFGDRRQEIAFIGLNLNREQILRDLKAALMTPLEVCAGPDGWSEIRDPLPDWHVEADPEY